MLTLVLLVFFDYLFIELSLLTTILIFTYIFNVTTLLFSAGIYLMLSGILSLLKDMDVLIGFLWVIDLGVGLIFFIFTLHFSSFLHQKSVFNTTSKQFFLIFITVITSISYFYFYSRSIDFFTNADLKKTWYLQLTYLNLYNVLYSNEANVLLMIKYLYFSSNSFEFFLINYSLFFGLVSSILACFLLKRFYSKILFSQIIESNSLENISSSFFIRNQNFYYQQNVHQSTRVWNKTKNK
jgi:hypothetical protein